MHEVVFYRDKDGKEPIGEYILELAARSDKESRIRLNKIQDYIEILSRYGTTAGEPYMKHLEGDVWELRPQRNRILFAGWAGNCFVLLHRFVKKTQKTPRREIEQAKRNLIDFLERMDDDE